MSFLDYTDNLEYISFKANVSHLFAEKFLMELLPNQQSRSVLSDGTTLTQSIHKQTDTIIYCSVIEDYIESDFTFIFNFRSDGTVLGTFRGYDSLFEQEILKPLNISKC
jgi:hypothetical protein